MVVTTGQFIYHTFIETATKGVAVLSILGAILVTLYFVAFLINEYLLDSDLFIVAVILLGVFAVAVIVLIIVSPIMVLKQINAITEIKGDVERKDLGLPQVRKLDLDMDWNKARQLFAESVEAVPEMKILKNTKMDPKNYWIKAKRLRSTDMMVTNVNVFIETKGKRSEVTIVAKGSTPFAMVDSGLSYQTAEMIVDYAEGRRKKDKGKKKVLKPDYLEDTP